MADNLRQRCMRSVYSYRQSSTEYRGYLSKTLTDIVKGRPIALSDFDFAVTALADEAVKAEALPGDMLRLIWPSVRTAGWATRPEEIAPKIESAFRGALPGDML